MAVELFSDSSSSMGMSPRISFSHDLTAHSGDGAVAIEQYIRSTSPSSSIDFDFCVFRESFHESSPADELFSEGKILPIEIKRKLGSNSSSSSTHPTSKKNSSATEMIKNAKKNDSSPGEKTGEKTEEKTEESDEKGGKEKDRSFWKFKRSYSLNCGSGYGSSLNLCPLPLMSRSNSTGSRSSPGKETGFSHHKQQSSSSSKSPLITSSSSSIKQSQTGNHQKPPLKKAYSNGVKVTPLINVPSASMFGLGSIFSPSKDKAKRKQ